MRINNLSSTVACPPLVYLVLLTPGVLHILERFCEGFLGISSHNKSLVGVMFVCILLLDFEFDQMEVEDLLLLVFSDT